MDYYQDSYNTPNNVTMTPQQVAQLLSNLKFQGSFGAASYIVAMIFTLFGNGLVVGSYIVNTKFRTSSHFLMLNLSMADLLYIIVIFLDGATLLLWYWPFGTALCSVMFISLNIVLYIRIYTLVLLTVEQGLMLWYPDVNRRPMYMMIMPVLWVMMCLSNILGPMTAQLSKDNQYPWATNPQPMCVVWFDVLSEYWWGLFIFAYTLPLIAIFMLYSVMIYRWLWDYVPASSSVNFTEIKRTAATVGLMVVLCAVLWLPLYITMIMILQSDPYADSALQLIQSGSKLTICKAVASAEMFVNPLLYALMIPSFRQQFWSILTCRSKGSRLREEGTTELHNIVIRRSDDKEEVEITCHDPQTSTWLCKPSTSRGEEHLL